MIFKSCYAGLLSLIIIHSGSAQTLYTPRNIRLAYKKGTRSPDGRPGPHYWQNHGRYEISIEVAPPDRSVRGTEKIIYFNNSPDTLKLIDFRLIGNIHKPGVIRIVPTDSAFLNSGVFIDTYSENGQQRTLRSQVYDGTYKFFRLNRPLPPHDSVQIELTWHFLASLRSVREGMIDSTTYFLAYAYPRVAVYDDYDGWDRMDFTEQQEFYNDFNDYILHVSAPKNFVVWATGTLQNPEEVLQPAYARKLASSMASDDIQRIASPADISGGKVTTRRDRNCWTWTANDISDMAFGLSDHYAWDASSVVVDDATGRRAGVQAAYNDTAKDFHQMVAFGRHSLDWFSHHWPGVAYPFSKTTIFQGYADMEYPMMVNDNTTGDLDFSRFVAEHELAHTWFPFYMGINESRFAFMDEGWATTFELLIGRGDLGVQKADENYKQFRVNGYTHDPSIGEDLPIITPADELKGISYGANAYGKPSLAYLAVKDLLGDDLFAKCLHTYMDRWHGKHPIPWDFFYSFNDVAGRDLNWFWNNWFFSNNYIDIAVGDIGNNKLPSKSGAPGGTFVAVRNVGGFAIPFDVEIRYTDGSTRDYHQTPDVWEKDQRLATIVIPRQAGKKIASLELKTGIWVDADPSDNKWEANK